MLLFCKFTKTTVAFTIDTNDKIDLFSVKKKHTQETLDWYLVGPSALADLKSYFIWSASLDRIALNCEIKLIIAISSLVIQIKLEIDVWVSHDLLDTRQMCHL